MLDIKTFTADDVLKPPFTQMTFYFDGLDHAKVSIWVNHALTGSLTLRVEEVEDFMMPFVSFSKLADFTNKLRDWAIKKQVHVR